MDHTGQIDLISSMRVREPAAGSWWLWLRQAWVVMAVYLLVSCFTNAHFMADTGGYVVSILAYEGIPEYAAENPVVGDFRSENPFWEFGHLLWRPLGLMLFKTFEPLSRRLVGDDPGVNMVFLLVAVNVLAGLLSALFLHTLIRRVTGRLWVAHLVAVAFICSHGVLNFSQSGSSYITGLALLLGGLCVTVRARPEGSGAGSGQTWQTALVAGLLFAGAVCMWFPYVLAIPAALAAPLFLMGATPQNRRLVLQTTVSFALAAAIAYGAVMAAVGVHTPADLRAWVSGASHGVNTSGITRAVFGLPRSLINMGNDGVLFKRFLLHDPFNPVSAVDVFRLSLWKLILVYLALASIVIALLLSPRGKRLFGLLLVNAIPLFAFAILFDGGAVERYLPLYPLLFLSLAWALAFEPGSRRLPLWLKVAPVLFIAAAIIANVTAMATNVLDHRQEMTAARINDLLPQINSESKIITTHLQDELINFQASFPFHPDNRHGRYRVYPMVMLNTNQVEGWREEFATQSFDIWDKGGEVWVSKRVLNAAPHSEWNWVEGDDRRVSWADLHSFFSQMQTDDGAGGEDGFVRLLPSPVNRQLLGRFDHRQQLGNWQGIAGTDATVRKESSKE